MINVLILRGIAGAGKTEYAKTYAISKVFSADQFWGPSYNFDPKMLGEAHTDCFERYAGHPQAIYDTEGDNLDKYGKSILGDLPLVIVDNTNISAYEIAPYIAVANACNLQYEIVTLWCDPVVAFKRNVHRVPEKVVFSMYQRLLREELPPFWNHRIYMGKKDHG